VVDSDKQVNYLLMTGHVFNVVVDASIKSSRCIGLAELKWEEKTDEPYHEGMKKDEWNDMATIAPGANVFRDWRHAALKEKKFVTDAPGYSVGITAQTRTLAFYISAKSAPNCDCPKASVSISAEQHLEWFDPWNIDWESSYFEVYGRRYGADTLLLWKGKLDVYKYRG
jgi:hypothetical protein